MFKKMFVLLLLVSGIACAADKKPVGLLSVLLKTVKKPAAQQASAPQQKSTVAFKSYDVGSPHDMFEEQEKEEARKYMIDHLKAREEAKVS